MQHFALIFIGLLLLCMGTAVAEEPKTIRITPAWVREHRDRIALSIDSEMSGRNHYFIKLSLEKESVCKTHTKFIATKTDYEKKPPDLTMYEMSMSTMTPTKVVSLTFTENSPYSLRPIFRIATMENASAPESPDFWIETESYTVDTRDFDALHRAYLESQKR